MDKRNSTTSEIERKLRIISLILISVGTVAAVCLVFFFIQFFQSRSNSLIPQIFKAEQVGATDDAVLIAWSSSEAAKEFVVRYKETGTDGYTEFHTDKPFAAIHDLKPATRYLTQVIPIDEQGEREGYSILCDTSSYCNITDVRVSDVTEHSAHIKWNYEGMDRGFTLIAYSVDPNGQRRVTSGKISVPQGSKQECTMDHLLSEVNYTVCVMPNNRYCKVGKSTFSTGNYSRSYRKYSIVRFVACPYNTKDSLRVNMISELSPGAPYKASMIFSGKAQPTDTFDFRIYVTDGNGNVYDDNLIQDVPANPNDEPFYAYRTVLSEFNAPEKQGYYYIYAAIDDVTVIRTPFRVI